MLGWEPIDAIKIIKSNGGVKKVEGLIAAAKKAEEALDEFGGLDEAEDALADRQGT